MRGEVVVEAAVDFIRVRMPEWSSELSVRIIMAESLRFFEEGSSAPSKPGAGWEPRGVADAHTVEIP